MNDFPRISFGMIVLNGEPFLRYNLRALYPYAHQIIVVEGAVETASGVAPDGHSTDGTLETLQRFKAEEDPDDKLIIITRDGFWDEKDSMSQAYAERATGDYLWQVDSDEFYLEEDMKTVLAMLRDDPTITAISFPQIKFWGSFDYRVDGVYLRTIFTDIKRIFKWGPSYTYVTHRPPTVHDDQGRDLFTLNWLDAVTMKKRGLYMYHYSLVFPKQVQEKSNYYSRATWTPIPEADRWAQEIYFELSEPFRVHNIYQYPSWLYRFQGPHPPQINALRADIAAGRVDIELRPTDDIAALVSGPLYPLRRWWANTWYHTNQSVVIPTRHFLRRGRMSVRYRSGLLFRWLQARVRS